jgi:hypothetical protein
MAKAKKRFAAHGNSSKRGGASAKPARKNKAKRTPSTKSKSKLQRVRTEVGSDRHAKLETMTLAKRIAAVAVDVASKRDEYRSIDPHDLAWLLGIDDANKPGGDWKFIWNVTPGRILAYHYINAPHGRTLVFEALIEDDGRCADLKTPYHERDGAFDELSECLIESE